MSLDEDSAWITPIRAVLHPTTELHTHSRVEVAELFLQSLQSFSLDDGLKSPIKELEHVVHGPEEGLQGQVLRGKMAK